MRILKKLREFLLGPAYFIHKNKIRESKSYRYEKIKIIPDETSIITKAQIKANPTKFLHKKWYVPLHKCSTGGTTGTPFIFYRDNYFTRQKERAYIYDIWNYVGYLPFDFRIVVRGNDQGRIIYKWFDNALFIPQNYFTEEHRGELIKIFKKKKFFLHVYPSTLFMLINYFGESVFHSFHIEGVLAGSEAFLIHQMEYVEKKFNLKIAHWYGHSEYAILARYCHSCHEFHFYPTYGKAILAGYNEEKKLLATSYNKYGTVFKNYFTEDYALVSTNECNIDSFPKVKSIIGRKQEYIIDKYGIKKAFGPYLFGIHNSFWEMIKSIQFQQEEFGELKIYYVESNNFQSDYFFTYLNARFANYNLSYFKVNQIEKTSSGKHRYFIQKKLL